MKMDRAFINKKEGNPVCCWDAPSVKDLKALFEKAGTPFDKMFEVEEKMADAVA